MIARLLVRIVLASPFLLSASVAIAFVFLVATDDSFLLATQRDDSFLLATQPDDSAQELGFSGCPNLSVTGAPANGEIFLAFDSELRYALSNRDARAVSLLVHYPLRVNSSQGTIYIADAFTLHSRFEEMFPIDVVSSVIGQEPGDIFCNWEGVMYGIGQIWARWTDRGYLVHELNVFDAHSYRSAPAKINFVCRTHDIRAVVDIDTNHEIRFRAWYAPSSIVEDPDLMIGSGSVRTEGSGLCRHPIWSFGTDKDQIEIAISKGGCDKASDTSRGFLTISVAGDVESWRCY